MALTEVRLRPIGPWRVGHHTGDKERVDVIYRSDALFSALTHAMRVLGWMDEWLDATARAQGAPAVRLSSLFPFVGKTRLITPPKSTWPPMNSGKLYLQGVRLVPLDVAKGAPVDESRWTADGASECLIPSGAHSPFQVSVHSSAAVDRLTGASEPHRTACLEFASNAGWWGLFDAVDSTWDARVRAAFRWLADSGFGGERSRGWGRASEPQFSTASSLFVKANSESSQWLLSVFSPSEADAVDWTKSSYSVVVRSGWVDSPSGSGLKKSVRMIEEGSVLSASELRGRAVDVAPDGFGHPIYRSGLALAVAPVTDHRPEPIVEPEVTVASESAKESVLEEASAPEPAKEQAVETAPVSDAALTHEHVEEPVEKSGSEAAPVAGPFDESAPVNEAIGTTEVSPAPEHVGDVLTEAPPESEPVEEPASEDLPVSDPQPEAPPQIDPPAPMPFPAPDEDSKPEEPAQ